MAKLKLDVELKDEKGNKIGEQMPCMVLGTDNQFILKSDRTPLVRMIDDPTRNVTLKGVIMESLLHEDVNQPLSGAEKSERYKLWLLVNNSKATVEMKTEEIAKIKECILNVQPILIAGQCEALIEGTK